MSRDEAEFTIKIETAEGWNPGIHDGKLFYEADHEGFFIAELEGKPVACAFAVAYDNYFGFVVLYAVRPEFQKKGTGMKLTEKCLEHLGDRYISGLTASLETKRNTRKL